jgi:phage terminase large subunit
MWAIHYPGSVGYVFAPNYPMVKRNLIPMFSSKWFLGTPIESCPLVADWNRSDMKITLRETYGNSEIWFVSLDYPERAEGPNLDWAYVDEARLLYDDFETAWKVILRRLRGSGRCLIDCPTGAWVTTTPDAPGSVLFKTFEGTPEEKAYNSRVFRWAIYDNPYLSKEFIADIERTHTGGLADRFIWGRFADVAAGSFAFDSTIHRIDTTLFNKDVIKTVSYGVDFGWTNPTAAVAVGFDGDGRAYVLDEVYQRQMRTEDLIASLKEMIGTHGNGMVMCDSSEPKTIAQLARVGIQARGNESKREDGIRELGGRFRVAGDERPRIYISRSCVNLISELQTYSAEKKENDHAVDALRYAIMGLTRPRPPSVAFGRTIQG